MFFKLFEQDFPTRTSKIKKIINKEMNLKICLYFIFYNEF